RELLLVATREERYLLEQLDLAVLVQHDAILEQSGRDIRGECGNGGGAQLKERARSRRLYFFTLPVDVFGSSPNSIESGVLNPGSVSRANAISSASSSSASGRSETYAFGRSPHFSFGTA